MPNQITLAELKEKCELGYYIVTDMDGVLVNIYTKWYDNAVAKSDIFRKEFDANIGLLDRSQYDQLIERKEYKMSVWASLSPEAKKAYDKIYRDDETFYDDLPLSPTGEILAKYANHKRLMIVSAGEGYICAASKLRFMQRHFPDATHIVTGWPRCTKADEIFSHNFTDGNSGASLEIFLDDAKWNIEDILTEFPKTMCITYPYGPNKEWLKTEARSQIFVMSDWSGM